MKKILVVLLLMLCSQAYAFKGTTYHYNLIPLPEDVIYIPCIDVKITEWEGDGVFDTFVEVGEPEIETFCSSKLIFKFDEEGEKGFVFVTSNPHEELAAEVEFEDDGEYDIDEKIRAKEIFEKNSLKNTWTTYPH